MSLGDEIFHPVQLGHSFIGSEVCLLLVWRKCAHEQKTIPEKLHVQIYDAPYTKITTPKPGNEVSQKRYDAYPDAHTTQQNDANTTNTITSIAKHNKHNHINCQTYYFHTPPINKI